MADGPFQRLRRFLAELKRRKVYRVAATYAVVAFVTLQAARLIFPATTLEGVYDVLVVIAFVGFPIALVLAWAFEVTPEGVRRTPEAEPAEAEAPSTGAGLSAGYKVLVGLGLVGAAVAGGWYLTGGGGSSISDRSVAVLPFETLGDTSQGTFTEGLHNDLLTRLQRVSDLTVIARPSVMRYEETDKPLAQVAEELNARWIVTAAVQPAGDQVRVNPRLIDPNTGTERWSDSYQGDLSADEVFSLQQEITRSIADALETELAAGERGQVAESPTGDLEAYRQYVRGREQLARRRFGADDLRSGPAAPVQQAVQLFRRAIERDSSFAEAWAGLADAAAEYPSEVPDSVVRPGVSQEYAARRALELDPDLAEAHASMGHFHLRNMDAPAARRELLRAIELNPSYWEAHHWLGQLYLQVGRGQEALEHLELVVELNPQHARARHLLYDAYLATGQAEKSLEEARLQQRLGLEKTSAIGGEVRALYHLGRLDEARQLARNEMDTLAEDAGWRRILRAYIGIIDAAAGDTTRTRTILSEVDGPLVEAWLHAALGEADQVFQALDRLEREDWKLLGASVAVRYGVHFNLEPLRDDPRYQKLLGEANRAWGLNPDGSFPTEANSQSDD